MMQVDYSWFEIYITPCPKPRMTQSDKWKKRPVVMRFRAYADELRLKMPEIDLNGYTLTFGIPMPKSWTKKKKKEMFGKPHQQTPDLDNIFKGILDILYKDDSHIYDISLKKEWSEKGFIRFELR